MENKDKTKEQLIEELGGLRQKIIELEEEKIECKKAEAMLKESERRYRNITDNSSFGISVYNDSGQCFVANKAVAEIIGATVEQVLSQNYYKIKSWRKSGILDSAIEALESNESKKKTFHIVTTFGKNIGIAVTFVPYYERDKKFLMFLTEDITERMKAEEALKKAHDELEIRVKERTVELREKNIALKVLLTQREDDKKELEHNILSNIKSLIQPHIIKLKRNNANSEDIAYLNIIESNLEDIISPFSQKLSSNYMRFTSKEIQIAGLIKEGKKDKEIMEIMNIAFDTVKAHRKNIRKKLGIHGKGINLRNKLLSI